MRLDGFDPNSWDVDPTTTITLTNDGELFAIIDACDLAHVMTFNAWCAVRKPHTIYARCYINEDGWRYPVFLHRVIMLRTKIKQPSKRHTIVDHRNGKGLDCRRLNLRWCTPKMNRANVAGSNERQRQIERTGRVSCLEGD